jgi:acyl carrier protein
LAIRPEEGRQAFDRVMRLGPLPQVLVSTGDLSARLARWVMAQSPADTSAGAHAQRHERPRLSTGHVAPANETEWDIAAIWQDLFNIDKIGTRDNFFELGGHSLLALQAVSRLRDRFGVGLTIEEFLELGSIDKIAAHLEAKRWVAQGRNGSPASGEERYEFEV